MDEDAMQLCPFPSSCPDTHFALIAEFSIPEGALGEARAGLPAVKEATKNGEAAPFCYFHGFGEEGGKIISRLSKLSLIFKFTDFILERHTRMPPASSSMSRM